jgi:hypothetical protein
MSVEGQFVVLFDEDVERAVVLVPTVLQLGLPEGRRHIQQHVQPWRTGEILANTSRYRSGT